MYGVKHILSFDCADKTLGVCLVSYIPSNIINEHCSIIQNEENFTAKIQQITQLINNILTVKSIWLFDLVPGLIVRQTEDSVRLSRLKFALKSIRKVIDSANIQIDKIIVVYQMGQNDLSRLISSAILYEFVDIDPNINLTIGYLKNESFKNIHDEKKDNNQNVPSNSCISIGPAFKNSIQFDNSLSYGTFAAKFKTSHTANKHHTAENFKFYLNLQSLNNPHYKFNIKANHSEINHIADAFMQAVYWIITNLNAK